MVRSINLWPLKHPFRKHLKDVPQNKLVDVKGEPDSVYFATTPEHTLTNVVATIAGSNGSVYSVSKSGHTYSCTCTGFQFRRKCKHVEQFTTKETEHA